MSDKRSIEAAFAKANVPLEITERSINRRLIRGGGQIVQMGIVVDRRGNEIIQMNIPSGEDIDVKAAGADPDHQQVVVMVHEPERKVVQQNWDWRARKMVKETIRVPEGKRKFLVGMDECHLFIAQMPDNARTGSVKLAHEDLRPVGLPVGKAAKKVRRTGEWFLIPATPDEVKVIDAFVKERGDYIVRKKVGIGSHLVRMRGRPHVVTESVVVRGVEFVRGRIHHPDHKVVKVKTWHRVLMNTEDRSAGSQWVD